MKLRCRMWQLMRGLLCVGALAVAAGCDDWTILGSDETPPADGSGSGGGGGGAGSGGGGGGGSLPDEISSIRWLTVDVSGWAQTASLNASVSGGTISMPYDKASVWPNRGGVNANCWAIVNIGGTWYAATFEYLKVGQQSKPTSVLSKTGGKGDHFKVAPLSSWTPRSGERFGIMVSGLARGGQRNVQERSNISMVTWP